VIETGPSLQIDLTVVLLAAFTAGLVLEMIRPAREPASIASRWSNNAGLSLFTYVCDHFLGTFFAAYVVYHFSPNYGMGLDSLPLWLEVVIVFLVLEFARYALHVAMHKIPLLWRLHAVHHADNEIDISTSFRHHPFESAVGAVPLGLIVLLLSGSAEALLLYRAFDLVLTVVSHANTELPRPLERGLRYLLVTPAFHRTHHMAERRFTDSNYGTILPWFDYLFGTYQGTTLEQQRQQQIGLDTHTAHEQRIDGMLLAPFRRRLPEH